MEPTTRFSNDGKYENSELFKTFTIKNKILIDCLNNLYSKALHLINTIYRTLQHIGTLWTFLCRTVLNHNDERTFVEFSISSNQHKTGAV